MPHVSKCSVIPVNGRPICSFLQSASSKRPFTNKCPWNGFLQHFTISHCIISHRNTKAISAIISALFICQKNCFCLLFYRFFHSVAKRGLLSLKIIPFLRGSLFHFFSISSNSIQTNISISTLYLLCRRNSQHYYASSDEGFSLEQNLRLL